MKKPVLSTTRLREIKKSLDPLITFQYIFSYAYLTLFLLLPIATIIEQAFLHDGSFSLHWFEKVLSDPDFFSLKARGGMMFEVHGDTIYIWGIDHGYIMNSLIVAATVTISTSLIGVLTALIIARYDFPGKNIFRVMVLIPMLATPFVNAYVIGKFFQPRGGLLNFLFYDVLHILPWRIDVNGLVGIAVAQTLAFYPIVYLNVFASLMTMDPTMEEQAESLGAGGFKLFRTITLPLSMPGLAAGATIVFIFSLEDLGAPIGFIGYSGNPLARKVMSVYVFDDFAAAVTGAISPITSAIAVILVSFAVAGFLAIKKYVTLKTYATISKGGRWKPRTR
ncbi:MAG: iron ABC transporter permease, partial [Thermoprotei archaeon]